MSTLHLNAEIVPTHTEFASTAERSAGTLIRQPLLVRISAWFDDRQRQDDEAGITAFLAENGSMITDDLERQIDSRFVRRRG
jgi:hypothetical protein